MKKLLSIALATSMALSLAACGAPASSTASSTAPAADSASSTASSAPAESAEPVTIKVFSNLPDRTTGQGLVEQTIFDSYMAANPNVTIECEELDDAAYKTKFKAYAAGSQMPDLVSVWGQPGFIDEVIDAGLLAELNPDDYKDYGFVNGSLDGFSADGKLYGLARNTDMAAFFYNAKIFEDNGWAVPTTYDELLALADKAKAAGVAAVSMDGADKWPLAVYLTDLMEKVDATGVMTKNHDAITGKDFSDPTYTKACELLQQATTAGLFQPGYETADYGTAKNLFTNGQAAMFYMGSWEMSMASSEDIPEDIRNNIKVFTMPTVEGGKGTATDISAWNGGGYSVTASGAQKEEAIKLLNYMFQPDQWTRIAWENGVCMSAQDFSKFATGSETQTQKDLMNIFAAATNLSGTPLNDMGTSQFKTVCEDSVQELAIGKIDAAAFLDKLTTVG
ncbi:MAG: extracellular solute-binding protein [Pygmaiobacter sp.]|nr:extracellular solute-binding protein [Pygmaiobacter sp.]